MFTYQQGRTRPFVWAHRGAAAVAPENTIAAYQAAEQQGADGVECDLHLSKDGVVVIHHDPYIEVPSLAVRFARDEGVVQAYLPNEAVADGSMALDLRVDGQGTAVTVRSNPAVRNAGRRWIAEMRWDEIAALELRRPGQEPARIPRLELVLEALAPTTALDLELKWGRAAYPELAQRTVEIVRRYRAEDRVLLSSFDQPLLSEVVRHYPEFAVMPIYHGRLVQTEQALAAIPARHVDHAAEWLTREDLEALQAAGIAVAVGDIGDLEMLRTMIAWGPEAIFLDDPRWMQAAGTEEALP